MKNVSNDLYQNIIDNSPDFVFESRVDNFQFTKVNNRACEFYGYSNTEFMNMNIFDIEVNPPVKEQVRQLYDNTAIGSVLEVFGANKKKDGTTFPVHVRFSKINEEFAIANVRDITELKKTQKALYESQEISKALLNAPSESAMLVEPDGKLLDLNTTAAQKLGKKVNELIGINIDQIFPREIVKSRLKMALKVVKSGKPIQFEDQRAGMSFSNTIYPVFDVNNKVSRLAIYARDITQEKKDKEALEISHNELEDLVEKRTKSLNSLIGTLKKEIEERKQIEEKVSRLSSIVEQTADHVIITDIKGNIEYVNRAFENLTGYSGAELIGKNPRLIKSPHHTKLFYKQLWDTIISGEVFRGILINKKKSGELFYEEKTISPMRNKDGLITHFVSTGKDVTQHKMAEDALKSSEEKLRMIYESSGDAITIHNGIEFLDCNLAALKIFRCSSKEEFLKVGPKDLNSDVLPEGQLVEQVIKERAEIALTKGIVKFESRAKRMDGTTFDAEVWVTPMKLEGQKVFHSIMRDITDRKQADKKLEQSKEKLRALASRIESIREEERIYIAREIHDELGHSLTALLIDLHSLNNKPEFQVERITSELQSMIGLVNHSIETIRKIASDLRPGVLDKLGLGAAVEWQLDEFRKRNKIECTASIEDEPLANISAEKLTAIFRIFQEITTNISRHAKATKVKVILKAVNKNIELFVSDNGKGIKKEKLDNIKSLGLLGMEERANMVGGSFVISSPKKGGTEVRVLIPIND